MRKISRLPLPPPILDKLGSHTEEIGRLPEGERKDKAASLWQGFPAGMKKTIQGVLAEMSTGLQRCMYCEDGQGTDIEHFRPKSDYPLHAFDWGNYLLACSHCNSNHKRTKFPLAPDKTPLLIDPAIDEPLDHIAFSPTTGIFEGRDDKGRETIAVCGLNREVCASGRQDAWTALVHLAVLYADLRAGDPDSRPAGEILRVIRRHPFQSVRIHMMRILRTSGQAHLLVPEATRQAFQRFPELGDPAW